MPFYDCLPKKAIFIPFYGVYLSSDMLGDAKPPLCKGWQDREKRFGAYEINRSSF